MSLTLNTIVLIACIFFLPESPRFLYANAFYDDCRKVIAKISRINGKGNMERIEQSKFEIEVVDGENETQ